MCQDNELHPYNYFHSYTIVYSYRIQIEWVCFQCVISQQEYCMHDVVAHRWGGVVENAHVARTHISPKCMYGLLQLRALGLRPHTLSVIPRVRVLRPKMRVRIYGLETTARTSQCDRE